MQKTKREADDTVGVTQDKSHDDHGFDESKLTRAQRRKLGRMMKPKYKKR